MSAPLAYAQTGWPVFPCLPGAKEPATRHGFQDATTEPQVIRRWWSRFPTANVAIATGEPAVDVLDVDVRPDADGYAALDQLKRAGLLAGAVALVGTPSGGLHVYFRGTDQPCKSLHRLGIALDFKARGGYVLAPPSVVAGRPYRLLDHRAGAGRLDWAKVECLLVPPRPRPAPRQAGRAGDAAGLVAWLAGQREGNRNAALFWAACRAVDAGATDLSNLVDAAVSIGLGEQEARRTVASALRIGAAA